MSKIIVGILLGALSEIALAQGGISGPSALAFAQKHKGLYASEISDNSPFSKIYTTRINIPAHRMRVTYDDGTKTITIRTDNYFLLERQEVLESCERRGAAKGTTAMGVTVSFVKQTCHRIFLRANSYLFNGDIDIVGNPKLYRDVLARGFDTAVTFTPVKSDGVVVEHSASFHSATIDVPYETRMNVYKFSANVQRIEYLLVGSKTPFRVDRFN